MNVIQERRCTNHIGYEVQHLTPKGWKACSLVFALVAEAEAQMALIENGKTEFRVYDAFETRRKT